MDKCEVAQAELYLSTKSDLNFFYLCAEQMDLEDTDFSSEILEATETNRRRLKYGSSEGELEIQMKTERKEIEY